MIETCSHECHASWFDSICCIAWKLCIDIATRVELCIEFHVLKLLQTIPITMGGIIQEALPLEPRDLVRKLKFAVLY